MTEQENIEELIRFVLKAHRNQIYHGPDWDQPYVFHLFRVASAVSPGSVPAALLHDCLEDTKHKLPAAWIDADTYEAVKLLTRDADVRYEDYIEAVLNAPGVAGEIAREVKEADLRDNLGNCRPGHRESLRPRYEVALVVLAG